MQFSTFSIQKPWSWLDIHTGGGRYIFNILNVSWVFPTYDGFIVTINYKVLKGKRFTSSFPPHAASLIMLEFLRLRKLFKSYGSLKKHWTNLSQWQVSGLHKEKDRFLFHNCYKHKRVPFYFAFNFVSWLLAWRTFDDFCFLKVLTTESLSAADGKKNNNISIHSDFFYSK